jgi:hypothetical protein
MKRTLWVSLTVIVAALAGSLSRSGLSQTAVPSKPKAEGQKGSPPSSNQVLMRDKLTYANKALEGLSVENFDKIAESAQMMRMISRAASWHVIDSPEYTRYSKNFQEQAADLERHAKEKNLDQASLDYMRISLTCVQCHKHLRDVRGQKRP